MHGYAIRLFSAEQLMSLPVFLLALSSTIPYHRTHPTHLVKITMAAHDPYVRECSIVDVADLAKGRKSRFELFERGPIPPGLKQLYTLLHRNGPASLSTSSRDKIEI